MASLQSLMKTTFLEGFVEPGWDAEKSASPVVIATRVKRTAQLAEYIELQRDNHWTKAGGRACVNYAIVDDAYNAHLGIPVGSHLAYTRLGQLADGFDRWHDVTVDNQAGTVRDIVDGIRLHLLPISRSLADGADLFAVLGGFTIAPSYGYAFYRGRQDVGMPMLLDALRSRGTSDALFGVMVRNRLIEESEIATLRLIQMQARSDQVEQMNRFIAAKGWDR